MCCCVSYGSEVLCKLVSHVTSRLADLNGRARRTGDSIYDIAGGACERVCDAEGIAIGFSEPCGVVDVGVSAASGAGAGEGTM